MEFLNSVEELEDLYGTPAEASTIKVTPNLIPTYRTWIEASRFCVLSTIGPEGTDGSPRGDDEAVVKVLDDRHVALPDWRGNQRLDSLRNIIRDPRVSLMFLVAGSNNAMRINGEARLTTDTDLRQSFAKNGKTPATVIVVKTLEVYSQCARAVMRAGLWSGENHAAGLPSVGDMLKDVTKGEFDGETYDATWPKRAAETLW